MVGRSGEVVEMVGRRCLHLFFAGDEMVVYRRRDGRGRVEIQILLEEWR